MFIYDDSQLRELLRNLKGAKKVYRELANNELQRLKEDVAYATHVDTGLMQSSWETSPLKMRDSEYHIFGELTNDATNASGQQYAEYELGRGGGHNAIEQGMQLQSMRLESSIGELLEGLLR